MADNIIESANTVETDQTPAIPTKNNGLSSARTFSLSRSLLFLFIIFALFFLVLEWGLRLYIPYNLAVNQAAIFSFDPLLGWSIEPNFQMCFVGADQTISWKRTSQFGTLNPPFRSPKPLSVFRILVTGDSHLHSSLSEPKTFSAQLERLINENEKYRKWINRFRRTRGLPGARRVEVINGAVGGYSAYQELLRALSLTEILDPDMIIWGFYGGNDLYDCENYTVCQIDDSFQGRINYIDWKNTKYRMYQCGTDRWKRGLWDYLSANSRVIDFLDYAYRKRQEVSWTNVAPNIYTQLKGDYLKKLSIEQIQQIIPDRNAYQRYRMWTAQAGLQRLYFSHHPNRIPIVFAKMKAMIAAYSIWADRLQIPVVFLHLPSFIESAEARRPGFIELTNALDVQDMQLESAFERQCKNWCWKFKVPYISGKNALEKRLQSEDWFEERDAHLNTNALGALGEEFAAQLLNIHKVYTMELDHETLSELTSDERQFAQNPWPRRREWTPVRNDNYNPYSVQLLYISAASTPGPWSIDSDWKTNESITEQVEIILWKKDAQGISRRTGRFPVSINKNARRFTFHINQYWNSNSSLDDYPEFISLEFKGEKAASAIYPIPWDQ